MDEYSDAEQEASGDCRRNGDGRRIRPSVCTRGFSRHLGRGYRAAPTWNLHPKLNEVIHQDFSDCSRLAEQLSGQDAAIFCLGVHTGAVSDTPLREVTVDYPIEFARALHLSSPGSAFSFLSGSGADPSGRSRMAFARYKGEAETALLKTGFSHVYIFRPAYIYLWSPVRSLTLGTESCARSIPCFGLFSRIK
jgi:uncharacterized protein YbjT (DUF2867 family)